MLVRVLLVGNSIKSGDYLEENAPFFSIWCATLASVLYFTVFSEGGEQEGILRLFLKSEFPSIYKTQV